MNNIKLTENERNVLECIIKNAKEVGDSGKEFVLDDVSALAQKPISSLKGILGSLQKKGLVECWAGDGYFDGEVTDAGIETYGYSFE